VQDFQLALTEAQGDVRNAMAPVQATADDEDPPPKPEQLILAAVQMVESAAQDLVRRAAGSPVENDVQQIATQAQELRKQAESSPNATQTLQSLDQLKSKAASLSAKL
jgi:phosphoenolpyruvate carboxylase